MPSPRQPHTIVRGRAPELRMATQLEDAQSLSNAPYELRWRKSPPWPPQTWHVARTGSCLSRNAPTISSDEPAFHSQVPAGRVLAGEQGNQCRQIGILGLLETPAFLPRLSPRTVLVFLIGVDAASGRAASARSGAGRGLARKGSQNGLGSLDGRGSNGTLKRPVANMADLLHHRPR